LDCGREREVPEERCETVEDTVIHGKGQAEDTAIKETPHQGGTPHTGAAGNKASTDDEAPAREAAEPDEKGKGTPGGPKRGVSGPPGQDHQDTPVRDETPPCTALDGDPVVQDVLDVLLGIICGLSTGGRKEEQFRQGFFNLTAAQREVLLRGLSENEKRWVRRLDLLDSGGTRS